MDDNKIFTNNQSFLCLPSVLRLSFKALLISLIYYYSSFFVLFISYFMFDYVFNKMIEIVLGVESLNGLELIYIIQPHTCKNIISGIFIMDKCSKEEFKEMFLEKAVKKFVRFRMKTVQYAGLYYWKEYKLNECLTQLKLVDKKALTTDELVEYTIDIQNNSFPSIGSYQYEAHFLDYRENKSALVIRLDHTMSDGLGVIGLIISMADNYSLQLFPQLKIETGFLQRVLLYLLSPFYLALNAYRGVFIRPNKNFPLGLKYSTPSQTVTTFPRKVNYAITKKYSLQTVSKVAKALNLTINDLVVCLNSKVLNKLCISETNQSNGFSFFNLLNTVSFRSMPKTAELHRLSNETSAVFIETPLIDNIANKGKEVKSVLNKYLKNPFNLFGSALLNDLVLYLLPTDFMLNMMESVSKKVDIVCSNVPGPNSKLIYNKKTLEDIIPVPHLTYFNMFEAIFSYNQDLYFLLYGRDDLKITPKEFCTLLEVELEELFSVYTE